MVHLPDVRVFIEIVDAPGFTGAARRLGLPRSSVGRQLSRLEETLGARLLVRTTRSVTLTADGRLFLPYARRLVDDAIEAASVLDKGPAKANGQLVVSAPTTFGRRFLMPYLQAYLDRQPHVRVRLQLSSQKVDLAKDRIDLALRLGPVVDPDIGMRRIGTVAFGLYATPGYLTRHPAPVEPADLARHDLIELRPPARDNRLELFSGSKALAIRCVPRVEVNDPDAAREACLADAGIATLPVFLARRDLELGRLVRVLDPWAPADAEVSVLFQTRTAPLLKVRSYVDHLIATITQARLSGAA